jgi:hypothetical protein
VSTTAIAERFIRYYWTQAIPYPGTAYSRVLQQNTGKQAAILNAVCAARSAYGDSLAAFMKNTAAWTALVRSVPTVVRVMPLWKLQTVGEERLDFLYANEGASKSVELRPASHSDSASFSH